MARRGRRKRFVSQLGITIPLPELSEHGELSYREGILEDVSFAGFWITETVQRFFSWC
jgi:hypothetical protein